MFEKIATMDISCRLSQNVLDWSSLNFTALIDMSVGMINLMFVLRLLKGCCYGNQLIWGLFANVKIDCLQSLLWCSKTECSITICIRALTPAVMQLHCVKIWWTHDAVTPEITFLICVPLHGYWAKIRLQSLFVIFPNALDNWRWACLKQRW